LSNALVPKSHEMKFLTGSKLNGGRMARAAEQTWSNGVLNCCHALVRSNVVIFDAFFALRSA
jgi:hypothetical protein